MASKLQETLNDLFTHHRKYTPFQKILICSGFVGGLLCGFRSWWFLFVTCTYTVTVYASVTFSKYLISCRKYFPSDAILVSVEYVEDFWKNLLDNFSTKPTLVIPDKGLVAQSETQVCHETIQKKETAEVRFYDSPESIDVGEANGLYFQRNSTSTCLIDGKISSEVENVIKLIKKDFVESWFKLFSEDQSVLQESDILFYFVIHSLQSRFSRTNTKKLFQFILLMFKEHIHLVREAENLFKVQSKLRRRKSSARTDNVQSSTNLKAVYKTVEECYGSKVELHPAVANAEIEHAYQKSIIELMLVHLLQEDMHDTAALVCALKEILTFNLLQKIMDLISTTTFLHERIIKITSDEEICAGIESIPTVTVSESEVVSNNVQSILTQRKPHTIKSDGSPSYFCDENQQSDSVKQEENTGAKQSDSHDIRWKQDTEIHTVSAGLCNECNRLCSADKDRIPARPHSCSLGTVPTFFDITTDPDRVSLQSFASISSSSSRDSATFIIGEPDENASPEATLSNGKLTSDHIVSDANVSGPEKPALNVPLEESREELHRGKSTESPTDVENKSSSNIFPTFKLPFPNPLPSFPNFRKPRLKSLSPTSESISTSPTTLDQAKIEIRRSLSQGDVILAEEENTLNAENTQSQSVFQNVRITSTEAAKEVGSFGEYTLYKIEYEALYQMEGSDLVHKTGIVKRRFREFVNLQLRLEDNVTYKKSLKKVKGPKRILPSLPFGNMGKDTVDSRKELLQSFLNSLIDKEDICDGEELKQFLGYHGDGHIAFVRKPPDNAGPRIDQRLVKTMSGVFDKIVEGLPSLPQQLPRIISPFDQREEKDDLADNNLTEDTDDIDLIFEQCTDDKVIPEKVESVFAKFVEQEAAGLCEDGHLDTTLGTSVLTWQAQEAQGTSSSHMTHNQGHMTTSTEPQHINALNHLHEVDTPLSDAVLGILTEALHKQNHWVCRENVIQAARVMLGRGLDKFLEEKVEFLTSTDMNVFYLKTLRESVWPNGELSTELDIPYTDLQKEQLKQQATRCLANFLPGVLHLILSSEEFDHALEGVMDSLKYEKLNRHFWYSVFDVVLEEVFPEVNTLELQRKLSTAVQSE